MAMDTDAVRLENFNSVLLFCPRAPTSVLGTSVPSSWRGVPRKWSKAISSTPQFPSSTPILHNVNKRISPKLRFIPQEKSVKRQSHHFRLTYHCRNGDVPQATIIYEEMTKQSILLTMSLYRDLLEMHENFGNPATKQESMIAIFQEALSHNIEFDILVYNFMIKLFVLNNLFAEAKHMLTLMKDQKITPDKNTIQSFLVGICNYPVEVPRIVSRLAERYDLQVDGNAILMPLLDQPQSEQTEIIEELFGWLTKKDLLKLEIGLCNKLLAAVPKEEKVISLLRLMKEKNIEYNEQTFLFLLHHLLSLQDTDYALCVLLSDIYKKNIQLSAMDSQNIIQILIENENLSGLDLFVNYLEEIGTPASPRVYEELVHLFDRFNKSTAYQRTHNLVQRMLERQIPVPIAIYNDLIQISQKNHSDQTFSLFEVMKFDGITPNLQTFRLLIRYCVAESNLARMSAVVSEMTSCGFPLDIFVYNSLLRLAGQLDDLKMARDVLSQMSENKITWDPDTLLILARLRGRLNIRSN